MPPAYNRFMMRFLHSAPLGLVMLALAACGAAPAPPPSRAVKPAAPGDQLSLLVEHYWDDYRLLNPQRLPQGAVTRFDAAGGYEISAQFLADSLALERRYLAAALAMPRPKPGRRIARDLRHIHAGTRVGRRELHLPLRTVAGQPGTVDAAVVRADPGRESGQYAVLSAKDFDNWQARADAYVQWTKEAIANMREGLRRGYTLPRVLVEEMLPILAALGADTPANVFYQPLAAIPATAAEAERSRLAKGISAGVSDKILPSYRALHDFLRNEYLPRARTSVGLSALPLGQSWYAFLVKRETGTALAPAEIHAMGKAEVERIHGRLQALLAGTAFAGDARGFFAAMRRDPHWSYKTPAELLSFYNELKVQTAAALPTAFAQVPRADFAIRLVENYRQAWAPPLSYQRATPNGTTAAVLYVECGRDRSATDYGAGRRVSARGPSRAPLSTRDTAGARGFAAIPQIRRRSRVCRRVGPVRRLARRGVGTLPRYGIEVRGVDRRAASARPGWSSTPDCTRKAGPARRRSNTCNRGHRSMRQPCARSSTAPSRCPARRWRAASGRAKFWVCAPGPRKRWARLSIFAPFICKFSTAARCRWISSNPRSIAGWTALTKMRLSILCSLLLLAAGSPVRADTAHPYSAAEAQQQGEFEVRVVLDSAGQRGLASATVRIHARREVVWSLIKSCAESVKLVPGLVACNVLETAPDRSWQIIRQVLDYSWYCTEIDLRDTSHLRLSGANLDRADIGRFEHAQRLMESAKRRRLHHCSIRGGIGAGILGPAVAGQRRPAARFAETVERIARSR